MADKSNHFFGNLERVVSRDRFEGYRPKGGTDVEALAVYVWNVALCEALYPSFQVLEVSLRNAIHSEIAKQAGPEWLLNQSKAKFLRDREYAEIVEAIQNVRGRKRGQCTEGFLVAELKFGFWSSLLDSHYERVWHKIIAGVFPNMPRTIRTRSEASSVINKLRRLRNAAFHHRSIWHWRDLEQQQADIRRAIGWICDSANQLAEGIDRFPKVHADGSAAFRPVAQAVAGGER